MSTSTAVGFAFTTAHIVLVAYIDCLGPRTHVASLQPGVRSSSTAQLPSHTSAERDSPQGQVSSRTAKPIVVYPNSGERYDAATMCWHGCVAAATLAEHAREWHRLGARLIDGCCRTTPADIHALRTWAAQRKSS